MTVERCGEQLLSYSQPIETDSDIRVAIMSLERMLLLANAARGQTFEVSFDLETANVVWADYDEDWRRRIGFEAALTKASDGLVTYQLSCWINSTSSEFKATGKITVKSVTTLLDDRYKKSAESELFFYVQNMKSGHVKATNFSIKLVQNTAYTPYTGQTATLTLPRTIYGGTVDTVTGEGNETWKTINLPKTGWVKDNSTQFTRFNNYTALEAPANIKDQFKNILCNVLPSKNTAMDETAIQLENANANMLRVSVNGIKTLEDFLSFLDAYSVQVCYKLATPTPFTAKGAQPIPALSGVNTVFTDADSVTVTGRADPIKRITDLEDAVASMTTT